MYFKTCLRRFVGLINPDLAKSPAPVNIELCEQRLAFSAIPFADALHDFVLNHDLSVSDTIPDTHLVNDYALTPSDLPYLSSPSVATYDQLVDVYAQSSPAHLLTGLTSAQSNYGLNGAGQTIAIIDTGIAYDHVALGAGYGSGHRVVGGYDFAENDSNPYDDAPAGYHGTAVAGVVGGTATGVAPGVDLVALRVFDDYRRGNLQYVESALRWVHDNRNSFENPITIVNMSLGVDFNTNMPPESVAILEDELQVLRNDGILVVVSAGNAFAKYQSEGLAYPASSSLVLPVSSVDSNGQLSDFSQRNQNAIAAPGRNISSTVPDYMLGSDGRADDYTSVSGTSFSAPYVAGASALIREAYEIIGVSNVSIDAIEQTLFGTADRIYDAVTNAFYSRLNIQNALDTILPDDTVGDSPLAALTINHGAVATGSFNGFVDDLGDKDVYHWIATDSGTLEVHFDSNRLTNSQWLLWNNGQQTALSADGVLRINVQAGQSYDFGITDLDQIGAYTLNWEFASNANQPLPPNVVPVELGVVDINSISVNSNGLYALQTGHDGLLTLQVSGLTSQGALRLYNAYGQMLTSDTNVENGLLRLDFDAQDATRYFVQVQGTSNNGVLDIANLVDLDSRNLQVAGTSNTDNISIDLSNGIDIKLGSIQYHFANSQIDSIAIDQGAGPDKLVITGNDRIQTVSMYSNHGSLSMTNLSIQWSGSERVQFDGAGGADRVYLYDTDGNDQLTIYPHRCQLDGAGYQFIVNNVERLYVDASSGGNDQAYMFDSAGDDYLSIRPQFSSMRGDGYFNYVTGFERVYAYANNGGIDTAVLYDSAGDDRYATSGDNASIVGYNYYSYTRYFENVESIASSGGNDIASIYSPQNAVNYVGADFISFQYNQWLRTARGFANVQSLQLQSTAPVPASSFAIDPSDAGAEIHDSPLPDRGDSTPQQGHAIVCSTESHYPNVSFAHLFDSAEDRDYTNPIATLNANASIHPTLEQDQSSHWLLEDKNEPYVRSKLDPLTYELLNQAAEQNSLDGFFEELADQASYAST